MITKAYALIYQLVYLSRCGYLRKSQAIVLIYTIF